MYMYNIYTIRYSSLSEVCQKFIYLCLEFWKNELFLCSALEPQFLSSLKKMSSSVYILTIKWEEI